MFRPLWLHAFAVYLQVVTITRETEGRTGTVSPWALDEVDNQTTLDTELMSRAVKSQ